MTNREAPLTLFGNGLPPFGSAVVEKSRFRLYSVSPIDHELNRGSEKRTLATGLPLADKCRKEKPPRRRGRGGKSFARRISDGANCSSWILLLRFLTRLPD